jgi:phage shock protein C
MGLIIVNKRIRLSKKNKVFAGVCGGLAEYFNIDPTFIRIGWVLALFVIPGISTSAVIIAYIICWAIFPLDEQ